MVDTLLLLGGSLIGYYLRFWWKEYPIILHYILGRGLFFAFVFQLSLYYFELYELKIIRDGSKFSFRFIQSVATTLTVLMITYYMFPALYLGRGVLLYAVACASASVFFWRIIYRNLVKGKQLNERILILGTGEFAKEIARQIRDRGDSGFDVIGHIDEKKMEGEL
ncbi:MAG: nucleoside-diphosphate sugar epimerase/dehydratase [Candidatus Hodarchaeota archaeon]